MKYYIIAGEASGDLHGSNLIKGLKNIEPDCIIRCCGGDLMKEAGAQVYKHYKETAIIGFWEVLKNIRKILKHLKNCKKDILDFNPDVVILIDYPGFNFRIAKFAHNNGFKVFYYIAPKIWAWKEKRGKRLKKYVDKLFSIFPFETEYFKKRWEIDTIYRGNPLLDSISRYKYIDESKEEFCNRVKIEANERYIALIAGSRKGEIVYLLPRMLKVMEYFKEYRFLLATAPSIPDNFYHKIIENYLNKKVEDNSVKEDIIKRLTLLRDQTYSIMKHSDAAIINSGTASLEGALIGVPQVVGYGASEITYQIAKRLVKGIKYISLANLILNKQIFKELIQHDCTPEIISKELKEILYNVEYRNRMKEDYQKVREILGGGGASDAIAKAMIEEIHKN